MKSVKTDEKFRENKVQDTNFTRHVKYEHLVAGLSGGVASTLILHPLDLLKIRFAVNDGHHYSLKYRGIFNGLSEIFKAEGIKGLYRGATPSTIGSGASWGLYFYFYNALKAFNQDGDPNVQLTPAQNMIAAFQAGGMTLVLTNPLWVAKTRLCLQTSDKSAKAEYYTGMTDSLVKLYRSEGVKGLYRGFVPGLFGVSHGSIQFLIYEEMKKLYCNYKEVPISTQLSTFVYLSFAAISKFVASGITYPYQVVRSRLQNQFYSYDGSGDCLRKIWKYEGYHGFYKGLVPNLVRVVPATTITFVTYENVSHFLIRQRNT